MDYYEYMGKPLYYKGMKLGPMGLPASLFKNNKRAKQGDKNRRLYYLTFHSSLRENAPKNLIVMYDIPHEKKKERDWFRRQLKNFHYIMIQKSVWVGPSPLPQDFQDYVKAIGLKEKLKTFKLARAYHPKGR
jgi:DNA-binding transcriptional regulator PaaX